MVIKAVICTLDNLPLLKEQIQILRREGIDEIVVVNNGSQDGTREWLDELEDKSNLTVVHRENLGAGPGRNAGLDAAGDFDYVLMLDGGIRPLIGGVAIMRDYLERHPDVDVVSPEIATCFTTDEEKAHRRMLPMDESTCFPQRALSSTAYALCTRKAWDGTRFSEEGPFGKKAWGCDDNEMQMRWNVAGIVHHDFSGPLLYRRQSGSFQRLFQETGIWPNQYGSGFEQRCVLMCQQYPEHVDLLWLKTNLQVSVVMLGWNEYPMFPKAIKRIHEDLKDIPHEVIFVDNGSTDETEWWLDTFALRWHHSQVTRDGATDAIVRRSESAFEEIWTGNVVRVDMGENRGTGEGYTAGIERARGKYIFLTDGDIIPHEGSIVGLYNYMEAHPELDFVCANPWFHDQEVTFDGDYENNELWPLGNYAYGFAMFKRDIVDAGIHHPHVGPFAGAGCGYDDVEFASAMYAAGFNCWQLSVTPYDHVRSDLSRSGHESPLRNIGERKAWLSTRWPGQDYAIMYHNTMPPEMHMRRVAVIGRGCDNLSDISSELTDNLNDICYAECFDLLDHVQLRGGDKEVVPIPGDWDDYIFIAGGNWDRWEIPDWAHPSIYWAIDMFYTDGKHRWPQAEPIIQLERAQNADRVFAVHQNAVQFYLDNGIDAKRLSGCADPKHEYPVETDRKLDWTALWHHCGPRIEHIDALLKVHPHGFVSFKFLMEWTKWINQGKCSLNISRLGELNWRPYEIMATRIPLITSRVEEIGEFFTEGEHYLGTDSPEETVAQVTWVVENPDEAQAIADRAYDLVLDSHTYYHRILEIFGG